MVTERDAENMWCPMARVAGHFSENIPSNNSFNRDPNGQPLKSCCYGASCMMWRWDEDHLEKGFCGLAGKDGA